MPTSEREVGYVSSTNVRKYKEKNYLLELKGRNSLIAEVEPQAWTVH